MTSNLILRPNTELSSEVFTKKTSLIARGLNEISLLKPSPESLYQTGMDYYEGSNGKPWDILKAYAYLVKSAEQGFVLAQWRLSCMLEGYHEAAKENVEKAAYWREKAALNGHLLAMYKRLPNSSETYIQELTHLAESGCSAALLAFIRHYIMGDYEHIEKDMRQAWYWTKRLVELGDRPLLSVMENVTTEFWDEVDKDTGFWLSDVLLCKERYSATERSQYYENRMIWLIEKAQQGVAFAQALLGGELYEIILNESTFFEDKKRQLVRAGLLRQQAATVTDEPIDWRKLAIFWLTKPAEQGLREAQSYLGGLYICNEKAVYWHRRSAEQGYERWYFDTIVDFNETDMSDAPKFTFEELEHYRLNNQDSI